jgi:hypothetical protein
LRCVGHQDHSPRGDRDWRWDRVARRHRVNCVDGGFGGCTLGVDAGGNVLVAESLNKVFKTMDACRAVKNLDGGRGSGPGARQFMGLSPRVSASGFYPPMLASLPALSVVVGEERRLAPVGSRHSVFSR